MADEAASNSRVTELSLAFAEALNQRAIPINGETGQQLRKLSNANFDVGWTFAGTGDVTGPGLSIDGAMAVFDGTDGLTIKEGPAGAIGQVWTSNGPGVAPSFEDVAAGGTVTSVGGTGTVNGITLTGTVTTSGNLTLGGALSGVSLTTQVTGTLPVANGGTGITSLGTGVSTALGVNVGTAGAIVVNGGAGGTPSSLTLTNATGLPIGSVGSGVATASNIWTGTSAVTVVAPSSLQGASAPTSVAYSATTTLDFDTGLNFDIGTLTGNITLANPSNVQAGDSGVIRLTQDGTGSRTITVGSNWKFAGGAPTLSTTAGAVDVIAYYAWSSTNISAVLQKAFA